MIKDLAEFLTCDYILYGGIVYRKQIIAYRHDLSNYEIIYVLLDDFMKGGVDTFNRQISFTNIKMMNECIRRDLFKLKPTCKLQLK